jgi:hypothetical protein
MAAFLMGATRTSWAVGEGAIGGLGLGPIPASLSRRGQESIGAAYEGRTQAAMRLWRVLCNQNRAAALATKRSRTCSR